MIKVGRIMWSSPLECSASGGADAKAIGKLNQSGQQGGRIGGGSIEGVVGEKIGGTALGVEFAEAVAIGGQRTLLSGVTDAGVEDFKGRVEKDDGCAVAGEQVAIGLLGIRSSTQGKDGRTRQGSQDEVEVIVLDGAEAAFTARGEEAGNGAVDARNLLVEVGERTTELVGEEASERALASPHESDEDQQRRWRMVWHSGGIVAGGRVSVPS